jgi:hypothetical protein
LDKSIKIRYKVDPIKERLEKQAQVFAEKCFSMHQIEWRYVLNQYQNKWIPILEEVYLYSYFKCLLYATAGFRVSELPENCFCILGHGIMYQVLNKTNISFEHNGMTVNYLHVCKNSHYEELIKLARSYDFLDSCISSEETRFYMYDEYYDRFLTRIAQEMKGTNGPHLVDMCDTRTISRYLTKDSFPLFNSFYSEGKDENNWRYSFNPPAKLTDSCLLFGKAVFITEYDSTDEEISYFDPIKTDDKDKLVKFEVSAIAGSTYPDYKKREEERATKRQGR